MFSPTKLLFPVLYGGLLATALQAAPIMPISGVTGWNQDLVWGAGETGTGTTSSMDTGASPVTNTSGDTWYGVGRNTGSPSTGLPVGPTASVTGDITFTLQSFTANNALLLNGPQTGSLSLTTPARFVRLALIGSTGNAGGATGTVVVTHADGSTETFSEGAVIQDWFGSNQTAYVANGRVDALTGNTYNNVGNNNPRIYEQIFTLVNTTSNVTSVAVTASGGHNAIMALSGEAVPEPTSVGLFASAASLLVLRCRRGV